MKKVVLTFIIGVAAGIPLTALFGPIGAIIIIAVASFVISMRTDTAEKKVKVQPKPSKLSKEDEELITAILPIINSKK